MKKLFVVLIVAVSPMVAHAQADLSIPTASDVATTTPENTPVSFSLSGASNDANAGGALVFATSSNPAHGALGSIGAGGSVTYTPETGYTGNDSFSYIVSEGATSSAPATAALTVSALADTVPPVITAPAAQSFAATTFPATPVLVQASATDDSGAAPAITYSPQSFSAGTTTVTWTATDGSGNVASTTSEVGVVLHADVSVDASSTCAVLDSDGVSHSYAATSSSAYIGICALEAAQAGGLLGGVSLSNAFPSLGLFLTAVDGVSADPSSQYWALYQNGAFASAGLSSLPILAGDVILLQLHDFSDTDLGSEVTIRVHSLIATSTATSSSTSSSSSSSGGGGGGGGGVSHATFNIAAALAYLSGKQNTDGSFSNSSSITDWTALAFAAADTGNAKTNLRAYLLTATPAMSSITDYERHAMALEAFGIDPYAGTTVNYIAPILASFDGTQIGDAHLDNDDIFAVLVLLHAGYTASDSVIQKEAALILSAQRPDGSWDGSPDMTGAAIQALGPLFSVHGVNVALGKAAGYLRSTEHADGSWDNPPDSTSWVQTAINGIIEAHTPGFLTESAWTSSGGYYPTDSLANAQQPDGAVRPASDGADTRVWSTSYALAAASGKSWVSILQSFPKPSGGSTNSSGGSGTNATTATSTITAATSTATTTPLIATTTPALATSTTPLAATTPIVAADARATTSPAQTPLNVKQKHLAVSIAPHAPAPTPNAPVPVTNTSQTAGVASSQTGTNFLSTFWHAVTSFFAHLF